MPNDVLNPTYGRLNMAQATRGLTRAQLYILINTGEIEAAKVGRATLIKLSTLDAYLERQRFTKFPSADEMRRRRKIRTERAQRSAHRSLLSGGAA